MDPTQEFSNHRLILFLRDVRTEPQSVLVLMQWANYFLRVDKIKMAQRGIHHKPTAFFSPHRPNYVYY